MSKHCGTFWRSVLMLSFSEVPFRNCALDNLPCALDAFLRLFYSLRHPWSHSVRRCHHPTKMPDSGGARHEVCVIPKHERHLGHQCWSHLPRNDCRVEAKKHDGLHAEGSLAYGYWYWYVPSEHTACSPCGVVGVTNSPSPCKWHALRRSPSFLVHWHVSIGIHRGNGKMGQAVRRQGTETRLDHHDSCCWPPTALRTLSMRLSRCLASSVDRDTLFGSQSSCQDR